MITLTNCILTAYIATGHLTANSHIPLTYHTIAAPRCIPLGTVVFVEGIGERIVEDRTARKYDGRWDLFVGSESEARKFGKQKHNIRIYAKGNYRLSTPKKH